MNSSNNKNKRKRAAARFIEFLYAGKRVINVDETSINITEYHRYSWGPVGKSLIRSKRQRISSVSVIMGFSSWGEIFFTCNRGSNNSSTL